MRIAMTRPLFAWGSLEDGPRPNTIQHLLASIPDARSWRGCGPIATGGATTTRCMCPGAWSCCGSSCGMSVSRPRWESFAATPASGGTPAARFLDLLLDLPCILLYSNAQRHLITQAATRRDGACERAWAWGTPGPPPRADHVEAFLDAPAPVSQWGLIRPSDWRTLSLDS
jgi:hypothetical protein